MFLTISRENGCQYCVAAHSYLADKASGVPREVTDAIRNGDPIPDRKLSALSEFTRVLLAKRGWADRSDIDQFVAAGYREEQVLEVVLAVAVKTLSNWSKNLFATPVDSMFADRAWEPAEAGAGSA